MSDEFERALRLLSECQMPGYDPEGSEVYPAREDGVDSVANGLAAAQVLASLAIADELRRMNDGRDQFHREVLEVLSGTKAHAEPECPVCGKATTARVCMAGGLTEEQWEAHHFAWFKHFQAEGSTPDVAWRESIDEMKDRFGPNPASPEGRSAPSATAQGDEKAEGS